MSIILRLQSVSKQYSGNPTFSLRDIRLDVPKGEILALMGESGSGKTTLLRLIAGLEDATDGEIFFQKKKILGPKDHLVAGFSNIRLVNQNLTLPHSQSIASSIAYQLKHYTKDYIENRTEELLEIFQLQEHKDKNPNQLSGGQKQRALFAWAIADEPDLLLMDEPLSHLDDMFKKYLYEKVFKILRKTKTTVIFATHQVDEVFRLAQEVVLLKNGVMLQKGIPEEVYHKPNSKEVAQIMGVCNILPVDKKNALKTYSKHIEQNYWVIRPNEIIISTSTTNLDIQAEVLQCLFMGTYYEVKLRLIKSSSIPLQSELVVYTSKGNFANKQIVGVKLLKKQFHILNH